MTDGSNPALRRHRPLLACVGLGMALLFAAGSGQAAPMRGAESRSGNTPVVRWYRTHANGVPVLSATITEQHIRNGYEGLDANMQVVKRVPPYSVALQARRKALLDQQNAQRMADRNLVRLYSSSVNAIAQRDRLLRDLRGRRATLEKQLSELTLTHQKDVASAAAYERRGDRIPATLNHQLSTQQEQMQLLQQNLLALKQQESSTQHQYDQAIQRLVYLEKNPQLLVEPSSRPALP